MTDLSGKREQMQDQMPFTHISDPMVDAETLFEKFENLMPFQVQDILLVSSLYDSFILREDGRLNELLIGESLELNLQEIPGITHVSSGAEALALAKAQPRFNLIVTNLQVEDMDAAQLAGEVKAAGLDIPVVVLAYDYREIKNFIERNPVTGIQRIFLWQGNARILISMVKYVEDKYNVLHDTQAIGVPVILVVEDNIRYYSSFLPAIYTELITQTRRIISEGFNVAHKLVRMRARPKILLSSNYEDAAEQVEKYRDYLLIKSHRVQGARPCGRLLISTEAVAHPAARPAAVAYRPVWIWRFRFSRARPGRSRSGQGLERTGTAPA
jgi:CheY-like chemotaxis protein